MPDPANQEPPDSRENERPQPGADTEHRHHDYQRGRAQRPTRWREPSRLVLAFGILHTAPPGRSDEPRSDEPEDSLLLPLTNRRLTGPQRNGGAGCAGTGASGQLERSQAGGTPLSSRRNSPNSCRPSSVMIPARYLRVGARRTYEYTSSAIPPPIAVIPTSMGSACTE